MTYAIIKTINPWSGTLNSDPFFPRGRKPLHFPIQDRLDGSGLRKYPFLCHGTFREN